MREQLVGGDEEVEEEGAEHDRGHEGGKDQA